MLQTIGAAAGAMGLGALGLFLIGVLAKPIIFLALIFLAIAIIIGVWIVGIEPKLETILVGVVLPAVILVTAFAMVQTFSIKLMAIESPEVSRAISYRFAGVEMLACIAALAFLYILGKIGRKVKAR